MEKLWKAGDSGICPVCSRPVCMNEDGTLWEHFTSFMNQDDESQPRCIGAGLVPLRLVEPEND